MFEIEGIRNKRVENCHDCSYAQDNNLQSILIIRFVCCSQVLRSLFFDEFYIQMGRRLSRNVLTTISNKYAYLSRYPQADGPDSN